jgi:molecular chaperone GrpE
MTKKSNEKDWEKISIQDDEEENQDNENTEVQDEIELLSREKLEQQLTAAEQTAQNNWNKYLQSLADFENYKKRAERDINNAYKFNLEKFILELLPVVDSLEKSLEVQGAEQLRQGVELTLKMLLDMLIKLGVNQLDPTGQPFNPVYHEAMSMQPMENMAPNTVITVFQKGYMLHDRLIRPARVLVAK